MEAISLGSPRRLTGTVAQGQNGQLDIDEAALKTALAGISDEAGNAFSYTANSGVIPSISEFTLARYVMVRANPFTWGPGNNGYYSVREIEVYSGGVNVARNKGWFLATGISKNGGTPVDGGTNFVSISPISNKEKLWFQVDLGSLVAVDQVRVIGSNSGSYNNSGIFVSANNLGPSGVAPLYAAMKANTSVANFEYVTGGTVDFFPSLPVIDTIAPTLTALARDTTTGVAADGTTALGRVDFVLTFGEAMNVATLNAADLQVMINGVVQNSNVQITEPVLVSGNQYKVTVSGSAITAGNGVLSLALASGYSLNDVAGNNLAATTLTNLVTNGSFDTAISPGWSATGNAGYGGGFSEFGSGGDFTEWHFDPNVYYHGWGHLHRDLWPENGLCSGQLHHGWDCVWSRRYNRIKQLYDQRGQHKLPVPKIYFHRKRCQHHAQVC